MLNTPNEWHNEEDTDELVNEELSDEEYEDEEYENEDDFSEENDESDTEDNDANENNKKKMIIIATATIIVLLLLVGGMLGIKSMKSKDTAKEAEAVESVSGESIATEDGISTDIEIGSDNAEGGEDDISISVEDPNALIPQEKPLQTAGSETIPGDDFSGGLAIPTDGLKTDDGAAGLQIDADSPATGRLADKNGSVTVSIGDVGRQNPFMPKDKVGMASASGIKKTNEDGLDFEVIEPPQLAEENPDIAKLLQTKVSGILYDKNKPSAIINIDGVDQLVKIGDVLSGFEIIAITQNKVVISSDSNVYRASVGQPLNAELITDYVEISNLETKFKGSKKLR